MHRDVDNAQVGTHTFDLCNVIGLATGYLHTARRYPSQNDALGGFVALDDLMGHAADSLFYGFALQGYT